MRDRTDHPETRGGPGTPVLVSRLGPATVTPSSARPRRTDRPAGPVLTRVGGIVLVGCLLTAGCRQGQSDAVGDHATRYAPPRPVPVAEFAIGRPDLLLMVTGGTNGTLEVCNCQGPMPGGLARRSGLVRSYRAAVRHSLLIDTGDLFWVDPNDPKNPYVLRGYGQIGYDAVALGDQEWQVPPERLATWLAQAEVQALSTGLRPPPDSPVRAPPVYRCPREPAVSVLSAVGDEALLFFPEARRHQLQRVGLDAIARRVEAEKHAGRTVVLIAHGGEPFAARCARQTVADLVLRAHTARTDRTIEYVQGTPVLRIGGNEYVGIVALRLGPGGSLIDIEYRPEVVDTRWPIDQRLIQTYQAYAHVAMRKALDAPRKQGLSYVSAETCGQCHVAQYENWKTTHHAHAYQTLQGERRTGDPDCLMCHTAGFGTKEGFVSYRQTPQLAGVTCQNCHRFEVEEHYGEGFRRPIVDEAVCTSCHTPVTDPRFDYQRKLPVVRCPEVTQPPPRPEDLP